MSEFKKEPRYVVFKIKDIEKYLTPGQASRLMLFGDHIAEGRADDGRPPFNAVVVEQDWPEFDVVWEMIEARMTGKKNQIDRLRAELAECHAKVEAMRKQEPVGYLIPHYAEIPPLYMPHPLPAGYNALLGQALYLAPCAKEKE